MMTNVLNTGNTANLAIDAVLEAGSFDAGTKAQRLDDPSDWTPGKIAERAAAGQQNPGAKGDFDD